MHVYFYAVVWQVVFNDTLVFVIALTEVVDGNYSMAYKHKWTLYTRR